MLDVPLWAWAAFGVVVVACSPSTCSPTAVPTSSASGRPPAGARVWVGALARLRGLIVGLTLGARGRRRVHDRLAAGEEPVGRQPVRLRADLRLLQGAARVPAPGAVLRRRRRPGLPRHLPRRRRRDRQQVHRDPVRLRGGPALERLQAAARTSDDELRPGHEPRRAAAAQDGPGARRVRRHEVLRPRRPASGSPPRCSRSWSRSRRPTWSSPSTACPPSSRSATTRSSSTRRNAFAILGLRALYFLLAGLLEKFHLPVQGPGDHPRLHRREADAAGRAQGDQHVDPGDPVAGQPRRHRRRAGRVGGAQPAPPPPAVESAEEESAAVR